MQKITCSGEIHSKVDGRDAVIDCDFVLRDEKGKVKVSETDLATGTGVCPCCRSTIRLVDLTGAGG